jgi:hypothetical protein
MNKFNEEIPIFKTKIQKNTEEYKENYKKMNDLVEDLNKKLELSRFEGDKKYIEKRKLNKNKKR